MKPKISVIIPFLNEADNLPVLVQLLVSYCSANISNDYELIFVDDGSTDGSAALLKAQDFGPTTSRLIRFSKNFGSHAALRAGIMNSTGDLITFYYADMQDPVELIGLLYNEAVKGSDIVWANRRNIQRSFGEAVFSGFYAFMMRRFALRNFPDKGFDVVMFNRKTATELDDVPEGNSSIFLQILSFGFRQSSITYDRSERKAGRSKWTLSKKIKLFIDSFIAFSYAPIRLVTISGLVMAMVGFVYGAYILIRALTMGNLNPGWPALICILISGFGITNISLGIIAEYLWRTFDASRGRKVFIVDEVILLNQKN